MAANAGSDKAMREVLAMPEIFKQILQLLDMSTLRGMLLLQKKMTTAVAEVVYEHVHVSRLSRMSRSTVSPNFIKEMARGYLVDDARRGGGGE
jgi:hypothetical protein